MKIELFTDFACPFCYIGFAMVEKLSREAVFELRHMPLELSPDESTEGSDLKDHVSEEAIKSGYEYIDLLAEEYGLVYKNKNKRFNTHRLHLAALYAEEIGVYYDFARLGFKYIFEYGENVGLPQVIDEIAVEVGIDPKSMNKAIDSGKYNANYREASLKSLKYKVDSVPSFIVNEQITNIGTSSYEDFKSKLKDFI